MGKGILKRLDRAEVKIEELEKEVRLLKLSGSLRRVLFPDSPTFRGTFESALVIIALTLMMLLLSTLVRHCLG